MGQRSHRRQVLLFFAAVILPSITLVFLSVRMIGQENELSAQRRMDQRKTEAVDLGQQMAIRLEQIRRETFRAQTQALEDGTFARGDTAVAMLGLVQSNTLLLPWDLDRHKSKFEGDKSYLRVIRQGEQAEFADEQYSTAADLYAAAGNRAGNPDQKAYAELLTARVLMKLGQADEGHRLYTALLEYPPTVCDEYGVPISLYAAARLLQEGVVSENLTNSLRAVLVSDRWMPPPAVFMLDGLADVLDERSIGHNQAFAGARLTEEIGRLLAQLEQALDLQTGFPDFLAVARKEGLGGPGVQLWLPYGDVPWLVNVDTSTADVLPLVIAVRADHLLEEIHRQNADREATFGGPHLVVGGTAAGDPLGSAFPDLKVSFAQSIDVEGSSWGLRNAFYLALLLLVVSFTLFGGYLLLRDVRRETNLATTRSQFVSSVSHELKTPLTAIRMFAEMLRMDGEKDAQVQSEYLDTIVEESERLSRLLNNVLDFSKIEQGTKHYRLATASLADIVKAAARTMVHPLAQEGFDLRVSVEEDLPLVTVDPDAIEQAILNLLANAMKYSADRRRIDLRLVLMANEAVIQVQDWGVGIGPEDRTHIFEKFYRAPSPENEGISGAGLGLALVDHIAKAHNGRVEVQSERGQGSTFSIHLPVDPVS